MWLLTAHNTMRLKTTTGNSTTETNWTYIFSSLIISNKPRRTQNNVCELMAWHPLKNSTGNNNVGICLHCLHLN